MEQRIVKAVAGVLVNNQQVLMASRPLGKTYSGYWEFPGGKIEVGESVFDAIIRELKEEIGVDVVASDCSYLTYIEQEYPETKVELDVLLITKWSNCIKPLDNQELIWHNLYNECKLTPLLLTTQQILNILVSKLNYATIS